MVEDKKEKETKKITEVELTQVVTETAQAFKLPDGTTVDINGYLVWLGNQILAIKRGVV